MKILIANHWLRKIGGSETFTYAMAAELKKQGHRVDYFTFEKGITSARIEALGIKYSNSGSYDLVLANHYTCVERLSKKRVGHIIQTCHGIFPKLEQPSVFANGYVSISSEIHRYILNFGFDSRVVLNGIDCNRFKPILPSNKNIKKVLSLSHSNILNKMLAQKLAEYNVELVTINKYTNPIWNIEKLMQQADLVISLGRGAYEAMACGCAVLVLDYRPYMKKVLGDGVITEQNINQLLLNNCSGRHLMRNDIDVMIKETFEKYSVEMCEFNRQFALEHLNISHNVNRYLNVLAK